MTRGFITIATGKEHYYKIAANLLLSYRYFTKDPYPFAIICDKENEYTALFDEAIKLTDVSGSFMDKFFLFTHSPYDETIFLDADMLAYGDLNVYWEEFQNATDFSATGVNVDLHATTGAWYNVEDVGPYGQKITYKSRVHAGVMFFRKSEKLLQMHRDCLELAANYDQLHFHTLPMCKDECIFGVAMPMNQMKAIKENKNYLAFYPVLQSVKANILTGKLSYSTDWAGHTGQGILMHWQTPQTRKPLYRFNAECLHLLIKYNGDIQKASIVEKLKYRYKLRYFGMVFAHKINVYYKKARRLFQKIFRK